MSQLNNQRERSYMFLRVAGALRGDAAPLPLDCRRCGRGLLLLPGDETRDDTGDVTGDATGDNSASFAFALKKKPAHKR